MRWELYPLVSELGAARSWLETLELLRRPENTVEAYGRSLNDYLAFCRRLGRDPLTAKRDHIVLYVNDLSSRPNPRGRKILDIGSGVGLANATLQLRLTAVRLFYDHLVEEGLRETNPAGRGKYTPGNAFAGSRERGLVRRYRRLPWIPSDGEWRSLLEAFAGETLRNKLMLLLSYDSALRRNELVNLEVRDVDFPYKLLKIRAEIAKNGSARVVTFSETTSRLLVAYLRLRRGINRGSETLLLSESKRNRGKPLDPGAWNKVVRRVAKEVDLEQFTPHTLRHLRLTHMARAEMDIHEIATFAGHNSLRSTVVYLHLSGVEIAEKVAQSMAEFDELVEEAFE
jgi:integrase/recombinase XerD